MLQEGFSKFWHKRLGRPYRLHVAIDQNPGAEQEVILLHGIGRSSEVWRYMANDLLDKPYHLLAFDLLGFGDSPKPDWVTYDVEDHARAVIATTLKHCRHNHPVTFVGHSMGCLIAVRVATLRPDLVKRLVLYQPPIYVGLPNRRRYSLRKDLYYRLYQYLLEEPVAKSSSRLKMAIVKHTGISVRPEILQPFLKSLRYTIMEQTTLQEMKTLKIPMDIIYGSRDMFVIRGSAKNVFKEIGAPLQTHTIREIHTVSKKASRFIARQIAIDQQLEQS